jgi:molybdopterin molybdotransferase
MKDREPVVEDVRMRGFQMRTRVSAAWEWIDRHAQPLPMEQVHAGAAAGRVLAEDVPARRNVPEFARSAMDGYALRGAETTGAGDYAPLRFRLIGESLPGRGFSGTVGPQEAVRIMTGAPVPDGADAVLPAEFAEELPGEVEVHAGVPAGKNIGKQGEDVVAGTCIARAGRRLRPQDLGLLVSVGHAEVDVHRQPRVRIIATGNELTPPGAALAPYQITDSNSIMLAALAVRDGGLVESQMLLPDQRELIREALSAPGADVVLISGGSSVGVEDHAPLVVAELGELAIHGVAMRPSSPTGIGRIGATLVFLLPGNPVSCLGAYDFFAGRALRRLGGRSSDWPYAAQQIEVGRKIVSAVGRVDYCRVAIVNGRLEPIATSGASILSSTTRAEGFVIVPEALEGYPPGAVVTMFRYDF